MFYAHQGVVYVTDVGREQKEWKQVEASGLDISNCIKYMWWVYGKKSDFRLMSLVERKAEVQKRLGLEKKDFTKLEKVCADCVEFYLKVQMNSKERNRQVFIDKQAELRDMLMKENDPLKVIDIEKALQVFEKRERELSVEIEREDYDNQWTEACPINLFSLPEEHKPLALRATL